MGRSISRDPSGFRFGPNVYNYCDDDPIDCFDATGCGPEEDTDTLLGKFANFLRPYEPYEQAIMDGAVSGTMSEIPGHPHLLAGPLTTIVNLHDSWWNWGYDVGNPKASLVQTTVDGGDAMLQAGSIVAIEAGGVGGLAGAGTEGAGTALGSGNGYPVPFETQLPESVYPGCSRAVHFQEANRALLAAIDSDADLNDALEDVVGNIREQLVGRRAGISRRAPRGWAWRHHIDAGRMQLVPRVQHEAAGALQDLLHPGGIGGMAVWGGRE